MSAREPARSPREVLALLREREVKAVDFRFMDFPGQWKHFTVTLEEWGRVTVLWHSPFPVTQKKSYISFCTQKKPSVFQSLVLQGA